jgi:hypothetical protein
MSTLKILADVIQAKDYSVFEVNRAPELLLKLKSFTPTATVFFLFILEGKEDG